MWRKLEGDKMASDGFEGARETLQHVSGQDIQGGEGGDFCVKGVMVVSEPSNTVGRGSFL